MRKLLPSALLAMSIFVVLQSCSSSQPTVTLKGSDSTASSSTLSKSLLMAGTIDASSLKLKVYKFAVSTSADCSSPIPIFTSTDGEERDMAASPSFGSGPADEATYPCVMIEVSKIIKTTPSSTSGGCTSGHEFSDIICNDTQQSQLIDGTAVTCSDARADEHVTIFITTLSAGDGGDRALLPPLSSTDTTSGIVLTNPFMVSGDTTGTLRVSLHHFLLTDGAGCFTVPPPFSFE